MNESDKRAIEETTQAIQAAGLRVFLAASGEYGFFTNSDGSRVVSFQADLGGVSFGGNYKTSEPSRCGSGWRMDDTRYNFAAMIAAGAPQWATNGATWRHTTLAEHLATYDKSSKYEEVQA